VGGEIVTGMGRGSRVRLSGIRGVAAGIRFSSSVRSIAGALGDTPCSPQTKDVPSMHSTVPQPCHWRSMPLTDAVH
jgi:hypothetical protein